MPVMPQILSPDCDRKSRNFQTIDVVNQRLASPRLRLYFGSSVVTIPVYGGQILSKTHMNTNAETRQKTMSRASRTRASSRETVRIQETTGTRKTSRPPSKPME